MAKIACGKRREEGDRLLSAAPQANHLPAGGPRGRSNLGRTRHESDVVLEIRNPKIAATVYSPDEKPRDVTIVDGVACGACAAARSAMSLGLPLQPSIRPTGRLTKGWRLRCCTVSLPAPKPRNAPWHCLRNSACPIPTISANVSAPGLGRSAAACHGRDGALLRAGSDRFR